MDAAKIQKDLDQLDSTYNKKRSELESQLTLAKNQYIIGQELVPKSSNATSVFKVTGADKA